MRSLRHKDTAQSDPWWRPELKAGDYEFGEAHDDETTYLKFAKKWAVDEYVDVKPSYQTLLLTNVIYLGRH